MALVRSGIALAAGVLVPIGLIIFAAWVSESLVPCEYLGDTMVPRCPVLPMVIVWDLVSIVAGGYLLAAAEPPDVAIHVALSGLALGLLFGAAAYVGADDGRFERALLLPAFGAVPLSTCGALLRSRNVRRSHHRAT
jgi:hypothetical protein